MACPIISDIFGTIKDSKTNEDLVVHRFTLTNKNGMKVQVLNYGATVTVLSVPSKTGDLTDIILGFDTIEGYLGLLGKNPYLGSVQGRSTSRIKNAQFTIDGRIYELAKNAPGGNDHFHGGFKGFDKKMWRPYVDKSTNTLVLSYLSVDGEEGYPGDLVVNVFYRVDPNENNLEMKFTAMANNRTTVDLKNALTLNLGGHETGDSGLESHFVEINANTYTPVDERSNVTGNVKSVEDSIFDLRKPTNLFHLLQNFPVEEVGKTGFCHNFCIQQNPNDLESLAYVGKIFNTTTGISMEVFSNQNGVSVYTSNFLADPKNPNEKPVIGKNGAKYYKHGGILFAPQNWPNAINEPSFPSAILSPGEIYRHKTILKFTIVE